MHVWFLHHCKEFYEVTFFCIDETEFNDFELFFFLILFYVEFLQDAHKLKYKWRKITIILYSDTIVLVFESLSFFSKAWSDCVSCELFTPSQLRLNLRSVAINDETVCGSRILCHNSSSETFCNFHWAPPFIWCSWADSAHAFTQTTLWIYVSRVLHVFHLFWLSW